MKTVYGLPKKREEVIEELQTAFANQNLDDIEYENRLNEAMSAKSIEDLELVVFDFPHEIRNRLFPKEAIQEVKPTNTSANMPSVSSSDEVYKVIMGEDKRQIRTVGNHTVNFFSLMGSQNIDFRKTQIQGNYIKIHVECLLGNTVIDLRNENLEGKHLDIWIGGGMGEIKILVPRGGDIQREAQMFGGSFKTKDKRKSWLNKLTGNQQNETPPISFTLVLHGNYWLGNVEVVY
jgi:predicted membrane protein